MMMIDDDDDDDDDDEDDDADDGGGGGGGGGDDDVVVVVDYDDDNDDDVDDDDDYLYRERQVERRITIRRSESPATRPRPRSSASPAMGRNTISRRGQNNFQWPPVRSEEQGLPTAVPIYISPHSRNSSRNSSPAPQRDGVNRYQTTAIPVTINRNN